MWEELTGKGITVAVLDTGISRHIDFGNRITGFADIVNGRKEPYDDNSHGSHVAGIICGNGRASHGKYKGIAAEACVVSVKILDSNGKGSMGNAIKGTEWILNNKERYGIRIVNISFASRENEYGENNPLIRAVDRLWDEGIVVVTAAGNNGPAKCSIGAPGMSRRIITVGTCDTLYGTDENGRKIEFFSGRGCPKVPYIKPELVARGAGVVSCDNSANGYTQKSGSSMAAPYVSGMVARLLQKYPDMKPVDVKLRLHDRAVNLGLPEYVQGWGTIDDSLF